jgi:predicted transcriptional regulator
LGKCLEVAKTSKTSKTSKQEKKELCIAQSALAKRGKISKCNVAKAKSVMVAKCLKEI